MASTLEKYRQYRKISRELSSKIMEKYVKADVLDGTGHLLGMSRGGVFVFDSENETNAFMDFALFEFRVGKKNAVEMYREEIGGKDEKEREILDAFVSSYTSLFRIVAVSQPDHNLILRDLLSKREDVEFTDIGFSQTAIIGSLLFLRIVPFSDFNMTSGIAFVFPGDLESYLSRKHKKLAKKVPSESDSIKRFVSFLRLNRTDAEVLQLPFWKGVFERDMAVHQFFGTTTEAGRAGGGIATPAACRTFPATPTSSVRSQ